MLADILGQSDVSEVSNQGNTKIVCDSNSSTQSEPSPPFESIAERETANTSNYSMMLNSTVIDSAAVSKTQPSTNQPKGLCVCVFCK